MLQLTLLHQFKDEMRLGNAIMAPVGARVEREKDELQSELLPAARPRRDSNRGANKRQRRHGASF